MKNVTARSEKKLGLAAYTFVMYGKDIVSKSSNDIGIISNAESNSKSAEFVSVIIPIFPSGNFTL